MPTDSTDPLPDATGQGETAPGSRLLLVDLGAAPYALAAEHVREVVAVLPPARLPGAPAWVRGVVNLRGQLLTVCDLAHRLTGRPVTSADGSTVVVSVNDRLLGLVVDDVHDVEVIEVTPAADAAVADATGLVSGLGRLGDEVVLVIDVPELVRQTLA